MKRCPGLVLGGGVARGPAGSLPGEFVSLGPQKARAPVWLFLATGCAPRQERLPMWLLFGFPILQSRREALQAGKAGIEGQSWPGAPSPSPVRGQ